MFEIEAPSGIIGLWDVTLTPSSVPTKEMVRLVTDLRESARKGDLFFLEAEDPVRYRIEVIINNELPSSIADEFEPRGGAFRLRMPSGKMRVASLPPASTGGQIDGSPGEYLVRPYGRRQFDGARYDQAMTKLAGDSDWIFRRRVDNVGAFGCLFLVAGAILLAIPFLRQYWWAILPTFAAPWLTYFLFTKAPRYRRAEKAAASHEQHLPHFVIVLKPSPSATDIPGGWIEDRG